MKTTRLIGLTGGIAAGKSSVSEMFRQAGIPVIDLDLLGREILSVPTTSLLTDIQAIAPAAVNNGTIDRRKLREAVFQDATARQKLEKLLHPLIWNRFDQQVAYFKKQDKHLVIAEAALLLEAGLVKHFVEMVVIAAPDSERRARLKRRDNLSDDLVESMFRSQLPQEAKLKIATHVIHNPDGSASVGAEVKAIVEGWQQKGWV